MKLLRVDVNNKEGTCRQASQRQGLKTSVNDDREKERAQDMEFRNQMVKERGSSIDKIEQKQLVD